MRRITVVRPADIAADLKAIGVDPDSYPLFLNKALYEIVRLDGLSAAQLNVLKQTALISGADLAIPRHAYRGSSRRNFSGILFATRREIEKIVARLAEQPWLAGLQAALASLLGRQSPPRLRVGDREYRMTRTHIMGVINITPDSFYDASRCLNPDSVARIASAMTEEGADFIDLGAESTRPGARPLPAKEEIRRLKPVLDMFVKHARIPLSVDTYKAEVAAFAIDHGAAIINDISGLGFDRAMARTAARKKAALVIMHIKGRPGTMQRNPRYANLMAELHDYFLIRLARARAAGIADERIIIDPGLGFGKRLEDNYEIIMRLAELRIFQRPVLVGHSRKSFIGNPFGLAPSERLAGTLGAAALLIANGVSILRVHDVREIKRASQLADRIVAGAGPPAAGSSKQGRSR